MLGSSSSVFGVVIPVAPQLQLGLRCSPVVVVGEVVSNSSSRVDSSSGRSSNSSSTVVV